MSPSLEEEEVCRLVEVERVCESMTDPSCPPSGLCRVDVSMEMAFKQPGLVSARTKASLLFSVLSPHMNESILAAHRHSSPPPLTFLLQIDFSPQHAIRATELQFYWCRGFTFLVDWAHNIPEFRSLSWPDQVSFLFSCQFFRKSSYGIE